MTAPKKKVERKVGRKAGTAIDSPELREIFLEQLRASGNVGSAAKVCNVFRTTPYQWKKKDPEFSRQWDEALDAAADVAEAEVRRRAIDGFQEPVFYQGKVVDYITKYSDRMLELHIKALKPEKYRERNQGEGSIVIEVNGVEDIKALRKTDPWGSDVAAQSDGSSKSAFKPITIEVQDLGDDRKGHATKTARLQKSKQGLTDQEKAEADD